MGQRGPIPNRSDDLARPRERKGSDQQPVTKGTLLPVEIPSPDEDWHKIARMLWDSLSKSGQSSFYQQSDWAFAYSLCDDISHYKTGGKWNRKTGEFEVYRSPEMLKALLASMSNLLVTEGDRRRVRIELSAPEEDEDAAVLELMSQYEDGLNEEDE